MPSPRTRLAVVALGAGLVLATPAAALAGPGRAERAEQVEQTFQAKCLGAIDKRLTALDSASDKLTEAKHVTDEHESELAAILSDTSAGLTSLADQIGSDTDPGAMKAHCTSVFADHRVFALILPRTRLVVASDTVAAAAAKLTDAAGRLEQAIAKAEANGADVTQAKADLEAMRSEITSAEAAAAGVPGQVMDLTPADWNADHEVLAPARQAMKSARTDLGEARELGRRILAGLRP